MIEAIPTKTFREWQNNLVISDNLPGITTSAVIKLSELEDFIKQIKPVADSISINLVRFTWNKDEPQGKKKDANAKPLQGCEWQFVTNGKTQIAIAISAGKYSINNDFVETSAEIINDDKILLLMPGGKDIGPTGHNPPSKKAPGTP
jgi:hypothetical protein